jgi:hypothetical protein
MHREHRLPARTLFPFWNPPSSRPSHPPAPTNSLLTLCLCVKLVLIFLSKPVARHQFSLRAPRGVILFFLSPLIPHR